MIVEKKVNKLEDILNTLFGYKLKISSFVLPKVNPKQKIAEIPEYLIDNDKLFNITVYYVIHMIVHRDKKIMNGLYIPYKVRKHYRILKELKTNFNKDQNKLKNYLDILKCLEIDRTLLYKLSKMDKDIYYWFSKGLKETVYNSDYANIYSAILIQRISPKKVKQIIRELQYTKICEEARRL